jgi:hypothetical protein
LKHYDFASKSTKVNEFIKQYYFLKINQTKEKIPKKLLKNKNYLFLTGLLIFIR